MTENRMIIEMGMGNDLHGMDYHCLLYTSDAADE